MKKFDDMLKTANEDNIFEGLTYEQINEECAILCSNNLNAVMTEITKYVKDDKTILTIIKHIMDLSSYSFTAGYYQSTHDLEKDIALLSKILSSGNVDPNKLN